MIVKLLTEHHLEFLSLNRGCRGSSESTLVKMSNVGNLMPRLKLYTTGRGNSAFETATHIYGSTNLIHMVARSRVRLSWATHYVGDLR